MWSMYEWPKIYRGKWGDFTPFEWFLGVGGQWVAYGSGFRSFELWGRKNAHQFGPK